MGQSKMEGRQGVGKASMQETRPLGSRKMLSIAKVGDELILIMCITVVGDLVSEYQGFQPGGVFL